MTEPSRLRLFFAACCMAAVARCGLSLEEERPHVAVLGAGYAGLTAANELASLGYRVTVFEKGAQVGGRAHRVASPDGEFTFDAGPSWYWMPEVFDAMFERYGRKRSEFYEVVRLDTAYRVIVAADEGNNAVDVPGDLPRLLAWADELDEGNTLRQFFAEAKIKYDKGVWEWIWKPMVSIFEMVDLGLVRAALTLNMFGSYEADLNRHTVHPLLRTILKWPVIFIGASPADAPAMYSLMTYAGHALGTFYPRGGKGMTAPAEALATIARDAGVDIRLNAEVDELDFDGNRVVQVCTRDDECDAVDAVVASADYHHVEQTLLPKRLRRYDETYWSRQVMSPSCVLFYLGFKNERLTGLQHHTFFFDENLDDHLRAVFVDHKPSDTPTFYVTAPAQTEGDDVESETLFVLVPISYRLNGTDTEQVRTRILNIILARLAKQVTTQSGRPLREAMTYAQSYGTSDFEKDFHAFRGNAFGLANTLSQSLVLKPSIDSIAPNMVFAGHMTNPGPGVPPSMVSGIVAAKRLHERLGSKSNDQGVFSYLASAVRPAATALLWAFIALHACFALILLASRRMQSWVKCTSLLYSNGRTYFAAATLMTPRRFLDTAAMYALFRVADDYVDSHEGTPKIRRRNLEVFMQNFWRCWNMKKGDYALHPVLPAVIEACVRNGYPREMFERFFKSMMMDAVEHKRCSTFDDLNEYMEGSAAVIGDFMVPILMGKSSMRERQIALPHARDLGNAFQLTNMIRDIGEDLAFGRQYMPTSICEKHGVRLQERNSSTKGFQNLIEEMFEVAERYYESADVGIAMLPEDVRDVIKVARTLYHRIHHEIRAADYNVFRTKRIRVKFWNKLSFAMKFVSLSSIFRMFVAEVYFFQLFLWIPIAGPMIAMLATIALSACSARQGCRNCTYGAFHLFWTLPLLAFLAFAAIRRSSGVYLKLCAKWALILCAVATVYTTPWDNYLVARGIWDTAPQVSLRPLDTYLSKSMPFFL